MKNTKTKLAFMLAIVLALALFISIASATSQIQSVCLKKGEILQFSKCNPVIADLVCTSTQCKTCASYDPATKIYCPRSFNNCNSIAQCSSLGNSTTNDTSSLILNVKTPQQDRVFNTRSIPISILTNKIVNLYWIDNTKSNARWNTFCSNCNSYASVMSFSEGLNNITLLAVDLFGKNATVTRTFLIDSTKPQINMVSPSGGFASGLFNISFTEKNPVSLKLFYGLSLSTQSKSLDLSTCTINNGKYYCSTIVDLSQYDGKTINYWFDLKDIANSDVTSRPISLQVDTTAPLINSLTYTLKGRTANLQLNVTEKNFASASYSDSINPKMVSTFCSSLNKGICTKSLYLNPGTHILTLFVKDKAGNSASRQLTLNV